VNLLMIAILPAIGEELLFRGVLLRLFREWTKNVHVAIIITALLFSFIHFQFYGFLPRFLMGVLFGYLVYWSGSLWVSVIAHFVNNGTAVIVAWLGARYFPNLDFNTFGSTHNPWILVASGTITALVLLLLWIKRKKEVVVTLSEPAP
jgi:membrane protease YdiL (CAAX protease family)